MNDATFLVLFIVFIAIMGLVPFLLRKLHIPMVISLLLVGMFIGPTGLGIDLAGWLSDALGFLNGPGATPGMAMRSSRYFISFIDSLGALGLIMLMALAGMEADFKLIKTVRKPTLWLSVMTFLVPAIAGYCIYRYFNPDDLAGKLLYASLFASHSVGIVFPVIRDLKLTKSRFGATVQISTILTDIASIVLLAVSVQVFRQQAGVSHMVGSETLSIFDHVDSSLLGNSFMPIFLLIVLIYLVLSMVGVRWISRRLMRAFHATEDMLITLVLLVILTTALIGEVFGINLVVGAFIAGLGLAKSVRGKKRILYKRMESIGYGFLIPFLFLSIGMETDFSTIREISGLQIFLLTVVGLIVSKLASGYITMKCCHFCHRESLAGGLMTVPQLSATLAAAAIGKDAGIISSTFFNAIIVLSIVTTLPVPTLVRWILKKADTSNDLNDQEACNIVLLDESDPL